MFHRQRNLIPDLSYDIRETTDWKIEILRSLHYWTHVTALDINPVDSLLALGSQDGKIEIFGAPPVSTTITVPNTASVRFLRFAIHTRKLICIDDAHFMHIWDLEGREACPTHMTSVKYADINTVELSPSHSHVFLALSSGNIKTFDLGCLRESPFCVSNPWTDHITQLVEAGLHETIDKSLGVPVEIVIHPRDLNTIFIAYTGGVIAYDLSKMKTKNVYELVIPAGAPGGVGYTDKDLLRHRNPSLTSISFHPSGYIFAAGYADGCIAFWAVHDAADPLLVQTFDDVDVNLVDGTILEAKLGLVSEHPSRQFATREPVFKLTWCGFTNSPDPRGGHTILMVLGGTSENTSGPTANLLPPFNPAGPFQEDEHGIILTPELRATLRPLLIPLDSYTYDSLEVVQDYLLIPRNNPHFSKGFDCAAILMITESLGQTRGVIAFEFPPPRFFSVMKPTDVRQSSQSAELGDITQQLTSTFMEMQLSSEPDTVLLPDSIMNGKSGILDCYIHTMKKELYLALNNVKYTGRTLVLDGGAPRGSSDYEAVSGHTKYEPSRIILTHCRDLTVRFADISSQLLFPEQHAPLCKPFPNPYPHLTIDLKTLFLNHRVVECTSADILEGAAIENVHLARDSFDLCISLRTGECFVYRLSERSAVSTARASDDVELILLDHVVLPNKTDYQPYLMLAPKRGPLLDVALSEIGLLATSYTDGSLFVVNMRNPKILLRHSQVTSKRQSIGLNTKPVHDPYTALSWNACRLSEDSQTGIRLLASCKSGKMHIFSLRLNSDSTWSLDSGLLVTESVVEAIPGGIFVLDKKGRRLTPKREHLSRVSETMDSTAPCILISAGASGVKTYLNINGARLGQTEWGNKYGKVNSAQVIEHLGSCVLVAFTSQQTILCYSLPNLDHLHTFELPVHTSRTFHVDETGDFLLPIVDPASGFTTEIAYGTLFAFRRSCPIPEVDLTSKQRKIPAQPPPISFNPPTFLNSWLPLGKPSTSGAQMDILLGGPDRSQIFAELTQRQQKITLSQYESAGNDAGGIAQVAQAVQNTLGSKLSAAMDERGRLLGDLEQKFSAAQEGSQSMVAQAKRIAAQQAAKRWFNF